MTYTETIQFLYENPTYCAERCTENGAMFKTLKCLTIPNPAFDYIEDHELRNKPWIGIQEQCNRTYVPFKPTNEDLESTDWGKVKFRNEYYGQ